MQYKKIVIGIDQSYKRTGITILADGKIKKVFSVDFKGLKDNTQKRQEMHYWLTKIILKIKNKSDNIIVVFERIRLISNNFISTDYIKSMAAMNAVIIDTFYPYDIKCYSVDTRAWKSAIVGTSKPCDNNLGVNPKKYPTIKFLIDSGYVKSIEMQGGKFNDDIADSICIAMFGADKNNSKKLKLEK